MMPANRARRVVLAAVASSFVQLGPVVVAAPATAVAAAAAVPPPPPEREEVVDPAARAVLQQLQREAEALRPTVETSVARCFLDAAGELPPPPRRTVFFDTEARTYASARGELPEGWERRELEPSSYYLTKYGTPLAYCRAIDLAGRAGLDALDGRRVLDFGYGTVGHLRMLAACGAEATGVDVDTFLKALYCEPSDQGVVMNDGRADGRVRLVDGRWPAEAAARDAIGGGYDLFISKNTLKRGYIHPEREVDPRRLVHLGVDDARFVRALHDLLKPGGLAVIYNLAPAQNPPDQPYLPWADGRCPFDRSLLESTGFEVLAYDVVDDEAARHQARLLGWDRPQDEGGAGMDLESDLFARYTILRRPAAAPRDVRAAPVR